MVMQLPNIVVVGLDDPASVVRLMDTAQRADLGLYGDAEIHWGDALRFPAEILIQLEVLDVLFALAKPESHARPQSDLSGAAATFHLVADRSYELGVRFTA